MHIISLCIIFPCQLNYMGQKHNFHKPKSKTKDNREQHKRIAGLEYSPPYKERNFYTDPKVRNLF